MKFLNSLGVLSSDVATGHLVWVDQVNGNDAVATCWRLIIPFRTLGAAKRAAQVGDTIIVMPGTYDETDLGKNGVNWHFLNGAKVNYTGTASTPLFNANSTMSFAVTGYGEFTHGGSSGNTRTVLAISDSSSSITFKCLKISGIDTCIDITLASTVVIECDYIDSTGNGGVSIAGGTLTLTTKNITAYGSHGVSISGGTVELKASRINSFSSKGLSFSGGTATITAAEISSSSSHGVEYNSTTAVLTIIGARLVTNWVNSLSRAVYLTNGATSGAAPLKLVRCVLLGKAGSSGSSVDAASSGRLVGLYGENIANISQSQNITFQVSTPLKVDANVT